MKAPNPPEEKREGGEFVNLSINQKNTMFYLFNRKAAERILGCEVLKIEVWSIAILVFPKGKRPKFVSKKLFKRDFVEVRKTRAQTVELSKLPRGWAAKSSRDPNQHHYITDQGDRLECSCKDWRLQRDEFKISQPCCKHQYAVLFSLGFADYQQWKIKRLAELDALAEERRTPLCR